MKCDMLALFTAQERIIRRQQIEELLQLRSRQQQLKFLVC
jgi:hypothetical protein